MTLTNPKTFENWCEKNGFRAGAMLDGAERWASECDGSFGHADIECEAGRREKSGRVERIRFDLVKPEIVAIENDRGERVGLWDASTPWTFGDDCDCAGTVSEAVYRFIG